MIPITGESYRIVLNGEDVTVDVRLLRAIVSAASMLVSVPGMDEMKIQLDDHIKKLDAGIYDKVNDLLEPKQ